MSTTARKKWLNAGSILLECGKKEPMRAKTFLEKFRRQQTRWREAAAELSRRNGDANPLQAQSLIEWANAFSPPVDLKVKIRG